MISEHFHGDDTHSFAKNANEWGTRQAGQRFRIVVMFTLLAGILGGVLSLGTPGTSPNAANYGEVRFENSCAPSVQQTLQQGIALLHSFEFGEATAAFRTVESGDPTCTIAAWGILFLIPNGMEPTTTVWTILGLGRYIFGEQIPPTGGTTDISSTERATTLAFSASQDRT